MATIIACLSQKGGVGKSTIARLLARTFASVGWSVKICDFNINQLTSTDWVAVRLLANIEPVIDAQPMNSVKKLKGEKHDLLVIDGAPDSQQSSLDAAQASDVVIIPTGATRDDLKPQVAFAQELANKGVPRSKMLFVLNKTTESDLASREAAGFIREQGFEVAETDITSKTGYQMAQNRGFSIAETLYPSLNDRADRLAAEIVDKLNALQVAA
ncbi:ParA family protein [Rhizobium lentis]|uniref:ParA family protein n=1 Tax=Rhizobium lentis TaxID=1138194 RepID=UPI001C82E4B1|nr:ParA family protein [Rhizobium lentis]MBX5130797.1 ParA family protein [Rhizobium lentis]